MRPEEEFDYFEGQMFNDPLLLVLFGEKRKGKKELRGNLRKLCTVRQVLRPTVCLLFYIDALPQLKCSIFYSSTPQECLMKLVSLWWWRHQWRRVIIQ